MASVENWKYKTNGCWFTIAKAPELVWPKSQIPGHVQSSLSGNNRQVYTEKNIG
ncbi:hypothetical protein [Mucilaginibacter ginsenosidivorans]|uniref:hypothetical protein n=1 Tax=Mucilaginibacter ginsenosidivorans TaxID=398053 RepID=UPI001651B9FC|nr:hypothetical protein [Mucilaginibacter ginsenosidivorans]